MAKLSQYRHDLIRHILETIAACEGGFVETLATEEGDVIIRLVPDIPPQFWCEDCKKRAVCKSKLMARWAKNC